MSKMKTIQLTEDEVNLLRLLLEDLNDSTDWRLGNDKSLMISQVLHDYDENLPDKINQIYQKLSR